MNYKQMLIQELRVYPISFTKEMDNTKLVKAMTLNENLISLGYTFKPKDLVKLASSNLDKVYDDFVKAAGEVKGKPMYPDFPLQVMEMDEAQYRMHQLMHYFSTYGLESLLGIEVSKGWLPEVEETEKNSKDETLLNAKVVSVIDEANQYNYVLQHILSKRQRLTLPEKELISVAVMNVNSETLASLDIPFKENLMEIFTLIISDLNDHNQEKILNLLHALNKHTGDVFTNIRYLLTKEDYRLSTSKRKVLVKLLESYPVEDLENNMFLSLKKSKNTHIVLDYISYNKYSRSEAHKQAVKDFRDGKLTSWYSAMEKLILTHDSKAIEFIAKRPGILLRNVNYLLKAGYDKQDIQNALVKNAKTLSMQTLVSLLNYFGLPESNKDVYDIAYNVLAKRLEYSNTPLKGKKVYIDTGMYDLHYSMIETNTKSEEGGYITSGMAIKIPETVRYLRYFVYWNDQTKRVDLDLHAKATWDHGDFTVGWNSGYDESGIVMSGDITHSDHAAEYINVDLQEPDVNAVEFYIHSYNGYEFKDIQEVFTGLMAVKSIDRSVQLYDPANCLLTHNLRSSAVTLEYGILDIKNRLLFVTNKPTIDPYGKFNHEMFELKTNHDYSIEEYLKQLIKAQNAEIVEDKDKADVVLRVDKGMNREISLIDENFFMDD